MAKDPAYLFYSSDFIAQTTLMSDEQVGRYIKLCCIQHINGHICEEDMLNICKTYDVKIFSKFIKDEDGLYFNPDLEEVINKRKAYSKSRSENRKNKAGKGKEASEEKEEENYEEDVLNICSSYEKHMGNGIGIENINININSLLNFIDSLDIYTAPEIFKIFDIYKKNCPDLCPITYERNKAKFLQKIKEFLREIRLNFDHFEKVCIKANKLKVIGKHKIDLKSVMNNHTGILSDKYPYPETEESSKNADGTPKLNWGGI